MTTEQATPGIPSSGRGRHTRPVTQEAASKEVLSVPEPSGTRPDWGKRLLGIAITIVVVVLGGWVAASFLPRWWAHRLGGQIDGSMASGILLGVGYGFVFTALPVLLLVAVFHKRRSLKASLVAVGATVLLAAPNLMTLGIVIGRGNAAHAGERTLDVEAPGVRYASLAGALLASTAVILLVYLVASRNRARRAAAEARRELAGRGDATHHAAT